MLNFKCLSSAFFLLIGGITFLFGQNDIHMIFPDDAIVHYAKWPADLAPRATSVQEWRREVAKNNDLVKADRYVFNAQGQLIQYYHYNDIISETLDYEYDRYGRPSTVRYANDNGPLFTYTYNYTSDHYTISQRNEDQLMGRDIFYFDEDYRLQERKTYGRLLEDSPLELVNRVVYVYSGEGDEATGEMHYDYVLNGRDKGKAFQWKRLHVFNEETGLRERTKTFKGALVWPGNWKRSKDLTEVVAEKIYSYDDSGFLQNKTLNNDIYDRVNERWSFTYQSGDLRRELWEELDLAGDVVASTLTRYHEHGGVAGFEYMRDRMGSPEYRSSFAIRE